MSKYSNKEAVHNFIHEALLTAAIEYEKKEEKISLQKANMPQFFGEVKEQDLKRIVDAFLSYQEALEKNTSEGVQDSAAAVRHCEERSSREETRKQIFEKIIKHFDRLTDEQYEYWKRTEKPDCD